MPRALNGCLRNRHPSPRHAGNRRLKRPVKVDRPAQVHSYCHLKPQFRSVYGGIVHTEIRCQPDQSQPCDPARVQVAC